MTSTNLFVKEILRAINKFEKQLLSARVKKGIQESKKRKVLAKI